MISGCRADLLEKSETVGCGDAAAAVDAVVAVGIAQVAAKLTAVDYPVLVKSRLGMTLYNMKMRIRFRNEATGAPELKVVSSIVLHDMGGGFTVMREKVLGSQVVPGR